MVMYAVIPETMDKKEIGYELIVNGFMNVRLYERTEYEEAIHIAKMCNGKVVELRIEYLDVDTV